MFLHQEKKFLEGGPWNFFRPPGGATKIFKVSGGGPLWHSIKSVDTIRSTCFLIPDPPVAIILIEKGTCWKRESLLKGGAENPLRTMIAKDISHFVDFPFQAKMALENPWKTCGYFFWSFIYIFPKFFQIGTKPNSHTGNVTQIWHNECLKINVRNIMSNFW